MDTFTTEQELPFDFAVNDGRGRPVDVDESAGGPVVASSDETVATVTVQKVSKGRYHGVVSSVTPSPPDTTQRVTFTADADLGEGVTEVVGFFDFNVTMDERTGQRIVQVQVGTPVDKA